MKSIRGGLTVLLLSGLAVLWIAAGAAIYFSVNHSLIKSLDAELALHARLIKYAARGSEEQTDNRAGARRLQDRIPAYDTADGDAFFQIWNGQGETLAKSLSLGEQAFPFPGGDISSTPSFRTQTLAGGNTVRAMQFRSIPGGGKGKGRRGNVQITILALDTAPTRETLRSVLTGITLVGLILGTIAALLVRMGVVIGLKPLAELARQTEELDAQSLDSRFNAEGVPLELQSVYAQLNDLVERLEKSFDRERRFNSDLAHELRTPIAELRMMNEVALKWEDQSGEPTHRETLQICCQLESTIETLLTLARCESGELSPDLKPISWEEVIQECWSTFGRRAEEKELAVDFAFSRRGTSLEADPDLLKPILNNLMANAVEYSPKGDQVEIELSPTGFSISNTAGNLDDTSVSHLFDRYWRADASRSDSNHVGLGLSLSRSCARVCGLKLAASLHEGRITFSLTKNDASSSPGSAPGAEQ